MRICRLLTTEFLRVYITTTASRKVRENGKKGKDKEEQGQKQRKVFSMQSYQDL